MHFVDSRLIIGIRKIRTIAELQRIQQTESNGSIARNSVPSPFKKYRMVGILLCMATVSWSKPVPAPLTVDALEQLFQEVNRLADSNQGVSRKNAVESFLEKVKVERAAEYEGSIIRVESGSKSASMGTKVDFKTERKPVRFEIKPPFQGLTIADYAKKPVVEVKRGSSSRVERHNSKAFKDSGIVKFELTLVEPNLNERDVHVRYWGWVDYKFTAKAALDRAKRDLEPVVDYAQMRLLGADSKEQEEIKQNAERLFNEANDEREREKVSDKPKKIKIEEQGGIDDYEKGIISGVLYPLIVIFIVWIAKHIRRWFLGRRKKLAQLAKEQEPTTA